MKEREDCRSCDNLLDQVRRLSSENATQRTEIERLNAGIADLDKHYVGRLKDVDRLAKQLDGIKMAFGFHSCPKSGAFCWRCEAANIVEKELSKKVSV